MYKYNQHFIFNYKAFLEGRPESEWYIINNDLDESKNNVVLK